MTGLTILDVANSRRQDFEHPDLCVRQLSAQGEGETVQCCLRSAIIGDVCFGLESEGRRDGDDERRATLSLSVACEHCRHEGIDWQRTLSFRKCGRKSTMSFVMAR